MKTYAGHRRPDGHAVVGVFDNTTDEAHELPLRLDLFNHSPTGFEWGYGGSGPSQLALAILADVLKDDDRAVRLHQEFKWALRRQLQGRMANQRVYCQPMGAGGDQAPCRK